MAISFNLRLKVQIMLELMVHSIHAGSVSLSLAFGILGNPIKDTLSPQLDINQMFLMIHVICIGLRCFSKIVLYPLMSRLIFCFIRRGGYSRFPYGFHFVTRQLKGL